MNYVLNKIRSQVQASYYETLDSFINKSIKGVTQYVKNSLRSHFIVELNLDMDNIPNEKIIQVLQLIDDKMGTNHLKSNTYLNYKGEKTLRINAKYTVFFKKLNAFMSVKGQITNPENNYLDGYNYCDRINVCFWGKGAYKLMKMFINTLNAPNQIVTITPVITNNIVTYELFEDDSCDPGALYWSSARKESSKSIENIYMENDIKNYLFGYLSKFMTAKKLFNKIEVSYKVGILLYGPPGTGKSSLSKTIACFLNANLYIVNMALFNTRAVDRIKAIGKSKDMKIILFEDIDYIFGKRQNDRTPEEKANGNALLQLLDGVSNLSNTVFIATTNDLNSLDDAIKRDGRFDLKIEMNNITKYLAKNMVKGLGIKSDDTIEEILTDASIDGLYNPANIQNRTIQYVFNNIENIDEYAEELDESKESSDFNIGISPSYFFDLKNKAASV